MYRIAYFALLLLTLAPVSVSADDWDQWRGPGRDGIARGAKLPATLPAKLPAPRWRAAVGEGYSSPVIAAGKLFILARETEDREACFCFDADSGKQLWRHAYRASFKPPDPRAGRGPNSTPTVDGDRVYMLGLSGMFHCLDVKEGQVLWKHDFAAEFWGVKKDKDGDDAWFPSCGAAASPLVLGELVVVPVGGEKAGALTAFDRATGKLRWKSLTDRSSYGSPILAALPEGKQLVGFTGLRMVGLRPTDQKLLWEYPFPAQFEQTVLTPAVWKDLVIFGGEKKPTVALRLKEGKDGALTQEVAWKNKDLLAYLTSPVVMNDRLIGLDARLNRLVAVDLANGETAWTHGGMSSYASLVVAGDRLLVLTNEGELRVLSVTPDRAVEQRKWQVAPGGTWAHLAVVGSRLYLKDKENVLCYDLAAE
jgi:outer membrane protein assembly factor BamB